MQKDSFFVSVQKCIILTYAEYCVILDDSEIFLTLLNYLHLFWTYWNLINIY